MINVLFHLRKLIRSASKARISRLLLLTLSILIIGAFGAYYFEKQLSVIDAFWWSIVTITTVGYGDITPSTFGGRIIGILVMLFGIGLLGMFTATIATALIEGKRKEEKGLITVQVDNHFVICGWSFEAKEIIAELRADIKVKDKSIVLIADIPEKPLEDENLFFLRGEVSNEILEKANLQGASVVIVLSSSKSDSYSSDAKAILNVLTIRSLSPHVYICVEIEDAKNLQHCKMAGANEIIVIGKLSSNLLVQAALDHGLTHFITELVSNRVGCQLCKINSPKVLVGKKFIEALIFLKKEHNAITLGVELPDTKKFLANPPGDYIIQSEDQLVIVAQERLNLRI